MADEPEIVQPVVTLDPAPDPAPEPAPVVAEPEATPEPAPEPEPKPKKPVWYMERIAEETRKRGEAERRAAALEAALSQAVKTRTAEPVAPTTETLAPVAEPEKPQTQDEVEKAAVRLVAQREFNDKCNAAYDAGTKEYKDFGEAVENLRALGALDPAFVESVISTDAPPKVLHYLGTHPEETQRILQLPLRRQVIELDRIATASPPAKPISNTAAPVKPLGGNARTSQDLRDDEPMDSWYAKRMKQREARMH